MILFFRAREVDGPRGAHVAPLSVACGTAYMHRVRSNNERKGSACDTTACKGKSVGGVGEK